MMSFTEEQRDALVEICNVGMSKSAKQLSALLNTPIQISIPEINILSLESIYQDHHFSPTETLAYVNQGLSDGLSGLALLIFHREQTSLLMDSVIGNLPKLSEKEIRACQHDAMREIGNIIISSCIGAIINMLNCSVALSIPVYNEDTISKLIEMNVESFSKVTGCHDVILIGTSLDAQGRDISGSLILVLDPESLNKIFDQLKKLLQGG